jgi:hypothetical protein
VNAWAAQLAAVRRFVAVRKSVKPTRVLFFFFLLFFASERKRLQATAKPRAFILRLDMNLVKALQNAWIFRVFERSIWSLNFDGGGGVE